MTVRLLADDLTGALDTAAELVPLAGPMPVLWSGAPTVGSYAIDSGTRERSRAEADAAVAGWAPAMAGASLAYKKVDSLLRGHTMAELASCLRGDGWRSCVVAPAFPHQGRVTRGGVQFARRPDGGWREVADVAALLREAGIEARLRMPGDLCGPGVTIYDAETEADLRAVVAGACGARGAHEARPLWCGSAGLAQALAHGAAVAAPMTLQGPVLGLFGSDQDATASQLAACGRHWLRLEGGVRDIAAIERALATDGVVMASLDLPGGLSRGEAARRIADAFAALAGRLARPGTLVVAGGETLRGLCDALGAAFLEVQGQFEPGLPHSVMRGGRWDGLTVVSKSGAFGGPNLWRDLLAAHRLITPDEQKAEKAIA